MEITTIREQLEKIVTVPAFTAWLVTKDPNETFEYGDNRNCVVAQFLKDIPAFQALIDETPNWGVGGDYVRVDGPGGYYDGMEKDRCQLPRAIAFAAMGRAAMGHGNKTFGDVMAALEVYTGTPTK